MDCRTFERELDRWVDPDAGDPRREAALRHAAGCPRCGELLAFARGERDLLGPDEAETLTRSILEATTGSACPAIEERLCDVVDGSAGAEDAALVAIHLRDCAACRGLAATLAALGEDLSGLQEIEPDPRFVGDVLDATTGRRSVSRRIAAAASAWWGRQIRRPRFAVEAAYALATLFALLFGPPSLPSLETGPGEAGTSPIGSIERLIAVREIESSAVGSTAEAVWEATAVPAARGAQRVSSWGIEQSRTVGETIEVVRGSAGPIAGAVWRGDLFAAWNEMEAAGESIAERWRSNPDRPGVGRDEKPTEPRSDRGRNDDDAIEDRSQRRRQP
ncbi:MAG: hypothetical protein GF346_08865 [Candidatus Eisenbacteria bacterium]|nr:hypothetical protein [Candidatus Latescibacterota bacterium]MBD3302544.1 hypothetical protein [Candidatus Eisenbacteria bacterium]